MLLLLSDYLFLKTELHMTDISVVIPSYNTQDVLHNTLDALANQVCKCSYETIVIDCSESDAVSDICEQFGVRCYREVERFNPGKGRNIGADKAQGSLLVFLDADVILDQRALENAWAFYQQGNNIFGGALELNEDKQIGAASYLEHYFFNTENQAGRPVCDRSNLSSALMLFDRKTFIDSKGFKDIPRMQDTELTERLLEQGKKLKFNPAVIGYQTQDSPLAKVLRKIFIGGKNLYFLRYADRSILFKIGFALLLPIITGFKMLRIFSRHLKYQSGEQKIKLVKISPLMILGGLYWMIGLYRSMIFGGGISKNRD